MSPTVLIVVQGVSGLLIVLLVPCVYRLAIGPTPSDRLQALETLTTLLIGIIITLALVQASPLVLDIALVLAAFGFIGSLAIARYIAEGRMS